MAKKFVKVTGLTSALNYSSGVWTLKTDEATATKADKDSILYITANAADTANSSAYVVGSHWIFAQGQLFGSNPDIDSFLSKDTSLADIKKGTSVEKAIIELAKKVLDASNSGVTSLSTKDDTWVCVEPDLSSSTGAVTLNVSHGMPGTAVAHAAIDSSTVSGWGGTATFSATDISIDARGHVKTSTEKTITITLPSTPVTALTTSATDSVINMTANTNATGSVTVNASHALFGTAGKKGETSDKTLASNSSVFKVLEVSTNSTGHVTSVAERTITLPATAFSDTTYTFGSGTQQFTYKVNDGAELTVTVSHMDKGTTAAAAPLDGTYISTAAIDSYGHITDISTKSNGVYSDDKSSHAANEIAVWDGATNKLKTSDKTIRTTDIADNSSTTTIPTTAQVIKYVQENKVEGVMTYKGTVASKAALDALTGMKKGDTYVLSADDAAAGWQKGDTFIYNGTSWDRIPAGDAKVTNKAITLTTDSSTIATVDGVDITLQAAKASADTPAVLGYVALAKSGSSDASAATTSYVSEVSTYAANLSTYLHNNTNFGYNATTISSSTGAYKIGDISINGVNNSIYGIDTMRAIKVNGTEKLSNTATTALDVSNGNYTKFNYINNKLTVDVSTTTLKDASNGAIGVALAKDVYDELVEVERTAATAITNLSKSVGTEDDLSIDWDGKFTEGTTAVLAIKDLSTAVAGKSTVSYSQTVTTGYEIGKITINGTETTIYGKEAAKDELVKAEANTANTSIYVLGQLNSSVGTANKAAYNTNIYADNNGSLHAKALYEGAWSVHDSSAGDWATI